MIENSSPRNPDAGRPGLARDVTRDQSAFWPPSGPLAPEVKRHLADEFGARVRALRGERGLTQKALAELLSCDPRTIRRLEKGDHRPTRQQVAWLARALSPEGKEPQELDRMLCDLVGADMRPRTRRLRRRELLSSIYWLPAERTTQRLAVERQIRQDLSRAHRSVRGVPYGT
ncbi:helix-turn-helix transcriptional regulator [Streptomyces sp. ID05-26A]|nr:helix-turn-helix transcriptional regulator [Streptomyces sp. ID05-26A]